jgi:hypothetical protein
MFQMDQPNPELKRPDTPGMGAGFDASCQETEQREFQMQ